MCSRFELGADPAALVRRFNLGADVAMPNAVELRPTDLGLVLQQGRGILMRWGLAVSWDKRPLINARLETLDSRPTFRALLAEGRVLIPATAWWEWREDGGARIKTRIAPRGGGIMALAGLTDGGRFTIVTRAAQPDLAYIHDRMPLVLPVEAEAAWTDPRRSFEEARDEAVRDGTFAVEAETPAQGSLF